MCVCRFTLRSTDGPLLTDRCPPRLAASESTRMRGRSGTLGTCLAEAPGSGGDGSDTWLCSLKKTQEGTSAQVSSQVHQPTVDVSGKSQDGMSLLEKKSDPSEADLLLHSDNKVLLYAKELVGRNSASVAAPSKAEGLCSASSEKWLAGMSHGSREALGRDWPERGHRVTDSLIGDAWASGWPGHPQLWEVGVAKGEPARAFPEGQGAELGLSHPRSELSARPHAHVEVLPEEETMCVSRDLVKLVFSEQAIGYKKMLPCLKSTSPAPQTTRVTGSTTFAVSKSLMPELRYSRTIKW